MALQRQQCVGKMYSLLPVTSFLKTGLSLCCHPCFMFVRMSEKDRQRQTAHTYISVCNGDLSCTVYLLLRSVLGLLS